MLTMIEDYSDTFKVERLLGRGAFGSVHLVKSRDDKKQYAVKVVEAGLDPKYDVWKELNVMSEMEHRNIVKLHHLHMAVNKDGTMKSLAIQMQYCPNGDLGNYLIKREGRALTQKKLIMWMTDLASAVEYMHGRSVLHRDLKPENILLTATDILKIGDFGVSKFLEGKTAATIAGTPIFLAPEVFTGQGYNEKADIYSLGRVYVCMATVSPTPVELSLVPKTYDVSIHNLIRRCTLENPVRRPNAKIVHKETQQIATKNPPLSQ